MLQPEVTAVLLLHGPRHDVVAHPGAEIFQRCTVPILERANPMTNERNNGCIGDVSDLLPQLWGVHVVEPSAGCFQLV
eukprot:7519426-Pyramimonas_sp.AAC.1